MIEKRLQALFDKWDEDPEYRKEYILCKNLDPDDSNVNELVHSIDMELKLSIEAGLVKREDAVSIINAVCDKMIESIINRNDSELK